MSTNTRSFFKDLGGFLMSKYFYIALIKIAGLVFLLGGGFFMLLSYITDHGSSKTLPNYIDQHIEKVEEAADNEGFDITIVDSVHIVGKSGGLVLTQLPKPGSEVKESRTVYVTVSKYRPDQIKLASLPLLYGREFASTQKYLKQSFFIESEVIGYQFDEGPENHILAAIYKNDTIDNQRMRKNDTFIEKGTKIHFILSKSTDERVKIPKLVCATYDAALFMLSSSMLSPGSIIPDETVTNKNVAYVYKQSPEYENGKTLLRGETVTLYLTQNLPDNCDSN
ncbi:MAG: PASTA domain-containing protein [Saprospiraceae bacterium]|nr:PASTA domain-containing protein [Saprospiraceae bacterium]